MDSLQISQGLSGPEPRPAVSGPSTAARDPDPKPVPEDVKPRRHHDHPRAHEHRGGHGRSHVQQGLRHIVREIRHALRDEIKAGVKSGELDLETIDTIRDLQRDFRRNLHGVFLQAGQKGGVDRRQVLEGMIEALQSLAAGLREVAGEPKPEEVPAEMTPALNEPGTLVDLTG